LERLCYGEYEKGRGEELGKEGREGGRENGGEEAEDQDDATVGGFLIVFSSGP